MTFPILTPPIIPTAFAEGAGTSYITNSGVLPTASQIGITNGAASLVDGFPPLNFQLPISQGGPGIPMSGQDLNAILYMITAHLQNLNAGVRYKFSSTLSAALGGYPVGAVLQDDAGVNEYINVLVNNTTNFNSTPAAIGISWIPYSLPQASIQGEFKNLKASASGATSAYSMTADELVVENTATSQCKTLRGLALSANTGAAVGANSLDVGVWAYSTWYAVHVIYGAGGTGLLFSLSATAPTLPSGYTSFARVGWIRTQSATNYNPLGFTQNNNVIQYKVNPGGNVPTTPIAASGTAGSISTPTYVAVGVATFVPPTASIISLTYSGGYSVGGMVAPNQYYGAQYSLTNPAFYFTGNAGGVAGNINMALEGAYPQNIYWASSGAAIAINGWEDNL